jgi:hypothetical protein
MFVSDHQLVFEIAVVKVTPMQKVVPQYRLASLL